MIVYSVASCDPLILGDYSTRDLMDAILFPNAVFSTLEQAQEVAEKEAREIFDEAKELGDLVESEWKPFEWKEEEAFYWDGENRIKSVAFRCEDYAETIYLVHPVFIQGITRN